MSTQIWLGLLFVGLVIGGGVLFWLFSRRAVKSTECYVCRQDMGNHFENVRIVTPAKATGEPQEEIQRLYRICQSCGHRLQIKEFKKSKK